MSRLSGKAGQVTAPSSITGIKSWTLDYVFDTLEGTGFDSSAHRVYTPGLDGWSGSFEGFKDAAPLTIGAEVALSLLESQTSTQKWTGQAIIKAVHPKTDVAGLVSYSYDFQGTGALVIPTG